MEKRLIKELEILEEALQLYQKSRTEDLEHDGHRIFQLTGEAARQLPLSFDYSPLACQLAQVLTDIWVSRYISGKTAA